MAKTVLLAMFLPSIIGSLGKIVGKGKLIVVNRCNLFWFWLARNVEPFSGKGHSCGLSV